MFANAFATAVIALPLFASSAFAHGCTRSYAVKEGDICDSISAANNVSTYQLAAVNPSIDASCSNLQPGQTLCLGTEGEDCQKTYVVQADNTCDIISENFGFNTTILYLNNPQINQECTNIYVGEVLCVSPSVQVPPAPEGHLPATEIPTTAAPANPTATATPTPPPPPPPTDENDGEDEGDDEDDEDIPEDQLPFCDELEQ